MQCYRLPFLVLTTLFLAFVSSNQALWSGRDVSLSLKTLVIWSYVLKLERRTPIRCQNFILIFLFAHHPFWIESINFLLLHVGCLHDLADVIFWGCSQSSTWTSRWPDAHACKLGDHKISSPSLWCAVVQKPRNCFFLFFFGYSRPLNGTLMPLTRWAAARSCYFASSISSHISQTILITI